MIGDETLDQAEATLAALVSAGLTVATAESCTGGLIAAALTHHSGSSSAVLGGVVSYSNAMKHALLGVDMALFDRVGAVSAEVAAAMAVGMLDRSGADLAVSVTGIAGPGGGSAGKPVGLVWFGIAGRNLAVRTKSEILPGSRSMIREGAVRIGLALLRDACTVAQTK